MPSINRIRVNNVKYNFGTQQYDDFSMRMYGRNTLYDLANGGGKSILMLLLLQNLIPNCTLDEKQPIEKLFRAGSGNTTIHSLVEWKLDEADIKDGYRYMTTGFCARKAKDTDENTSEENGKNTAAIEYFNYCIFYREYNKNDIINLPLSKGNERITFSGLKTYLKELAHKDMGLEIRVFERKGEYQRFISRYGLHESHWEIIRGINKTEGHVRTYFETNYKTTRKVVEDLLIEEIIEKAFLTRTGKDGNDDTMAETLLDIKDKLNVLAQKKRDIANYDHQIELINVLEGKVNSCIGLYEEYDAICEKLADIYVTGRTFTSQDSKRMEELAQDKERSLQNFNEQKLRLENMKIAKDNYNLAELKKQMDAANNELSINEKKMADLRYDMNMKESVNDYLGYLDNKKQLEENQLIIANIMKNTGAEEEKMAVYSYNRKLRDDKKLEELLTAKEDVEKSHNNALEELEYCRKCIKEGEISQAVAVNTISSAVEKIEALNKKLGELTSKVAILVLGDTADVYKASDEKRQSIENKLQELTDKLEADRKLLYESKYNLSLCEAELVKLEHEYEQYEINAEEYRQAGKQFSNIMTVYGAEEPSEIVDIINNRINGTLEETFKRKNQIEALTEKKKCLDAGRLFGPGAGASKVMDYIATRHGHMVIHGADYIAALTPENRTAVLNTNKGLPYGVVVKHFADIAEDVNLSNIDTEGENVFIYDMDKLEEEAIRQSDNVIMVAREPEYYTDEKVVETLKKEIESQITALNEEIELINEKLATYREDLAFVSHLVDERFIGAADKEREYSQSIRNKKDEIKELKRLITELTGNAVRDNEVCLTLKANLKEIETDVNTLLRIEELNQSLKEEEARLTQAREDNSRLETTISALQGEAVKWNTTVNETTSKLDYIAHSIEDIEYKWTNYFEAYYPVGGKILNSKDIKQKISSALGREENIQDNETGEIEILDISDEELETEFMAMLSLARDKAPDIEDKKKLVDALSKSMDRMLRTIKKRGIEIADIEAGDNLYITDEAALKELEDELARLNLVSASLSQELKNYSKAYSKLEGSIEYAITNIKKSYGAEAYVEEAMSIAEINNAIMSGDKVLKELENKYEQAVNTYNTYYKEQGFMLDLYKDVKRIIDTNDIDTERGKVLEEDKDTLRQTFENCLMKFDRSRKNMEKARNELMRFKGQTAETLSEMGVYEMANTIRTDVVIPENYYDAKVLLDNLLQIIAFINLEKERVEKGIEDMVAIKENFCTQCLQRCMDVKTELEKLPKLSRITMGEDVIKMVDLNIPYVKEEFLKQRMSDYIDDIVKGADAYEDERKRVKYIRDCLALKRLFGVMVTDINNIKLNLYKRERIKEQSRYLKYEEAVGSTGQSQGIYIQFLVAIINYISGMYSYTAEDMISTKTIFIDNPFGAAKDIYIWEPIFAMLAANHVQLIVPARGATPAITGRFDVNYVLGQQMVGNRQQTVVIDYTSKTNQEELEYQELSYEQATFDFV
jgi:hypothetical protein